MGRGGSKKSKPILAQPRPAPWYGTKILPHPRPTTYAGRGKPAWGEAGRGGLSGAGWGKIDIPTCGPPISHY